MLRASPPWASDEVSGDGPRLMTITRHDVHTSAVGRLCHISASAIVPGRQSAAVGAVADEHEVVLPPGWGGADATTRLGLKGLAVSSRT